MTILQLEAMTPLDNLAVGGKAAGLIRLVRLGIPVPKAIIVPSAIYSHQAARCNLLERIRPALDKSDWTGVETTAQQILLSEPLADEHSDCILRSYREMNAAAVAVRSSATCEDQKAASAAGQYDSFLNIANEKELLQAVRQCWASLWNRRALMYRHRLGINHYSVEMAVIIQEMVPADISGVLFTVDPLLNDQSKMRLEVIAGLGDALVSGTRQGETLLIDRNTDEAAATAVAGLLEARQVAELCAMALTVENNLDGPQDIEFAFANRKIFFLQTRPLTGLADISQQPLDPLGKPSFLDTMVKPFVDERYVVAPRPLDNIVVRLLLGGHLYVLKEWGAKVLPTDEEAVLALVWRQAYRLPPVYRIWAMFLNSTPCLLRQLKTDWRQWWKNGPEKELKAISEPVDLAKLADQQLFERAEMILSAWAPLLNERMSAAGGVRAEFLLKIVVILAVGRTKHQQIMADLMAGGRTPTVALNEELWQLSRIGRSSTTVLKCVQQMKPAQLQETGDGRKFLELFESFINRYGHREGACWYLTTPTWRQDQTQVWRILASLVGVENRTRIPESARTRRLAATALVEKRLRYLPCMLKIFRWLKFHFYHLNVFRETSHYDLTRPLDALQEVVREWGRRLADRGVLENEKDVGFLTYDEVRKWLCTGCPPPEEAWSLVVKRRAKYKLVNAAWLRESATTPGRGKELKGIGASPGVARGKVRIIRGEHEFDRMLAGEVLVSPYTNPAWTSLFSMAAAVITETGGAASHAAIVAREYGVPAVMAIPGATRLLKEGQDITVDGDRGVVII